MAFVGNNNQKTPDTLPFFLWKSGCHAPECAFAMLILQKKKNYGLEKEEKSNKVE
jgi:hypothetical protein